MQLRRLNRTLISALLVAPVATLGAVLAQHCAQPPASDRLIGMNVPGAHDEELAEMRGLAIDAETGDIEDLRQLD